MNTRKLTAILIAVAFIIVTVFSLVGILSVKKIQVNYAVSAEQDSEKIQEVLDTFLGKNLLFLDTEEISKSLKDFYRIEVLSVEKQFPNVIKVNVKERREIYYLELDGSVYVTTENAFVINSYLGQTVDNQNVIKLNLGNGLTVSEINLGSKIKTDNDVVLNKILDIAKRVNLTDRIKEIFVEKYSDRDNVFGYEYDVCFVCHTGVKIRLVDLLVDGEIKGVKAFDIYDTVASDFQKRFGEIQVIYIDKNEDGIEDTFSIKHVYDDVENKQDDLLFETNLSV